MAPAAEENTMQQMSVVTLGVGDIARSRRFYVDGFGWKPVFENGEIVFFQMNGFVLGLWDKSAQEKDMARANSFGPAPFALAHNVRTETEVAPLMDQLAKAGGEMLKPAAAPPHGGIAGYVADPDGHAWEIAFNPAWPISPAGHVTFGV
jgi:uncharacterized protein